jgi:hypothetical protein
MALKRRQMPSDAVSFIDINNRCYHLLQKDSTNRLAYETMMLHAMLGNRLDNVSKIYKRYGKPFNEKIPDAFAEAFMLIIGMSKDHDMTGYAVSREVQDRFFQFFNIVNKHKGNNKSARDELFSQYSRTYLFYLLYYSPSTYNDKAAKKAY